MNFRDETATKCTLVKHTELESTKIIAIEIEILLIRTSGVFYDIFQKFIKQRFVGPAR